jgi:hypothetical protein
MKHPIHKVRSFEQIGPHQLRIGFEDGLSRVIDFKPILWGALYEPLLNPSFFSQVRLDPEVHTLVWPNGADFDPATLHDWPEHEAAWRQPAGEPMMLRDERASQ